LRLPDIVALVGSEAEYTAALDESHRRAVVLFKHSPTCPVSAAALSEFVAFVEEEPSAAAFRLVDVIGSRAVARLIASRCGVKHESPQALVFRDGRVVGHASHGALDFEWFRENARGAKDGAA